MNGFIPPFRWRRSDVYNLVEDSTGKLFCFIAIDGNMDFNASQLVKILNQ